MLGEPDADVFLRIDKGEGEGVRRREEVRIGHGGCWVDWAGERMDLKI